MNKIKIKRGDQVLVVTGENKGAKGTVLKILYNSNKAIVEGVNTVKDVLSQTLRILRVV